MPESPSNADFVRWFPYLSSEDRGKLSDNYIRVVTNVCSKFEIREDDAYDVAIEALVIFQEHHQKYNSEISSILTYFGRYAFNVASGFSKKKKTRVGRAVSLDVDSGSHDVVSFDKDRFKEEWAQELLKAETFVLSLGKKGRRSWAAFKGRIEGKTDDEIARSLNISRERLQGDLSRVNAAIDAGILSGELNNPLEGLK